MLYINSTQQDKKYVRVVEICKGSKIYSTDENDLYKLNKELNELGFKTRMGRNCGYGYMSSYYSENGKLCTYDTITKQIVEIGE